jgi:tRNA (guanine37-N1)-methyltransferase
MSFRATVLTLYPEMFPGPLGVSLAGRALGADVWALETVQIRDFATDRHRTVDDTPAGGGVGMVMRADVLARAIDHASPKEDARPRLLMSPRGLEEVSLGDYILSGGEPAAIALLDAVVRLLPGVMGNEASGEEESFEKGLLEHPHYTRPQEWEGRPIPDMLLSGNHAKIAAWRREEAQRLTAARRPDLMGDLDHPFEK